MIKGLGIDIIEIERIAQALKRQKQFIDRLFTRNEQISSEAGNDMYIATYYAGRFAAKEAVVKALGTGFRGITWHDIQVLKDSLGKPYVTLSPEVARRFNNPQLLITISHSKSTACACAIWQT